MQITSVSVRKIEKEGSRMKGIASILLPFMSIIPMLLSSKNSSESKLVIFLLLVI